MPNRDNNITISLNISKALNEKLEIFSKYEMRSKSNLCEYALNKYISDYVTDLELRSSPKKLRNYIGYLDDQGYDTSHYESLLHYYEDNPDECIKAKQKLDDLKALGYKK